MFGPRRFSDIRANLPGISAKVLTEWGYAVEPVMQELGRWAAASPLHDPTLPLSPVSFMLSLRTMLDTEAARNMEAEVLFTIGTVQFTARLANGAMPVMRDDAKDPDVQFEVPAAPPLAAVFYGRVVPETVGVQITGAPDCLRVHFSLQLTTQVRSSINAKRLKAGCLYQGP